MGKDIQSDKAETVSNPKRHLLSWVVFVPTVFIVLLSLIPVVFPALLARLSSPFEGAVAGSFVTPWDTGLLAAPLVIVNVIIVGIGFAYYKLRHERIRNLFNKISSIEFSRKKAIISLAILIAIFIGLTAGTLAKEETWVDYAGVKSKVQTWTLSDFGKNLDQHLNFLLLSTSLHAFGNIRIVPFIVSIALLIMTYFFSKKITSNRFAGLVSTAIVLQSQIFVAYSTTASYTNVWVLMYLFSLYLIEKFWPPSPVPYFLSIFAKALTVAFLPMTFYFISRSSMPRKNKIYSLASYGVIVILIASATAALQYNLVGTAISFDSSQFWQGFSAMAMQMRFDYITILFLLPVTVMLFFASRKGKLHADTMMIFILTVLFTAPLLLGYTEQTNQPYRFVSLVVFFAIGVGVLLSKRTRQQVELSSSMQ